jgi:hypothetical protein
MHLLVQPTQHLRYRSSTQPADIIWHTIMSFSMITIDSQHLLLFMGLDWGNIWLMNKVHIVSLHNGQANNEYHLEYVWYISDMDINIISKSWPKRCGLKVKMNEDEDFLLANNKGTYLQTNDIARHSYITNIFTQPFPLSHAIMHAVVGSEPQLMAKLCPCRLSHISINIL